MDGFNGVETPNDENRRVTAYFDADAETRAMMREVAAGDAGSLATWKFIDDNQKNQDESA